MTSDVSLAQTSCFACPQCGQTLQFSIWLVVDVAARPDLAARLYAGDLHSVRCPNCGSWSTVDAPLLVYIADHNPATGQPPLLFSPAQRTSSGDTPEEATQLLLQLAQRLGDSWQEAWLAEVATVQRSLLPVALSEDPAEMLRHMQPDTQQVPAEATEAEEAMPAVVAAALNDILEQLAAGGITVGSVEELEQVLTKWPELRAQLERAVAQADS
jgi:hypothetical protein